MKLLKPIQCEYTQVVYSLNNKIVLHASIERFVFTQFSTEMNKN